MAYNLRSRLTSTSALEGSSVAQESEGLGLGPVEFAVPMSEPTTAGHGPDLLGSPIVIEGSPEALQTAATSAPTTSQIIPGTEPGIEADDELTGSPDTVVVHPTSSVYGAGAAGSAMVSNREDPSTLTDPSDKITQPNFRDPSKVRRFDNVRVKAR